MKNLNNNASVSMRVSTKGLTYNPDPDHHTDKNNCRQLSVHSHLKQWVSLLGGMYLFCFFRTPKEFQTLWTAAKNHWCCTGGIKQPLEFIRTDKMNDSPSRTTFSLAAANQKSMKHFYSLCKPVKPQTVEIHHTRI